MATLFAQSIAQFAPLRTFARMPHAYVSPTQLVRELFPKALFDEQSTSYTQFFEIAWSFLSFPEKHGDDIKYWFLILNRFSLNHRTGGLPAHISSYDKSWYYRGGHHRNDKDPRTGLTLPAHIHNSDHSVGFTWYKNDEMHRIDKHARTGLTLPAVIEADKMSSECFLVFYGSLCNVKNSKEAYKLLKKLMHCKVQWMKDGYCFRIDKDEYGMTLPAVIMPDHEIWYLNGYLGRDDRDSQTGSLLPSLIYDDGTLEWHWRGKLHRDEIDPNNGELLPARIKPNMQEWWIYNTHMRHVQIH